MPFLLRHGEAGYVRKFSHRAMMKVRKNIDTTKKIEQKNIVCYTYRWCKKVHRSGVFMSECFGPISETYENIKSVMDNASNNSKEDVRAIDVAKYIIYSFQEIGDCLSNMKLQKLLYYVQGWHLAYFNVPAFDEKLEAWALGPVQPGVYNDYKKYGYKPITEEVSDPNIKNKDLLDLIDAILDEYGGETAYALHQMTHEEKPWIIARGDTEDMASSNNEITQSSMLDFFKSQKSDK